MTAVKPILNKIHSGAMRSLLAKWAEQLCICSEAGKSSDALRRRNT